MQALKNLGLQVKLIAAFAVVGAIMAGIGWFGTYTVGTVNGMVTTLYEQELQGMSAIKDVNISITAIGRLARAAIISTDVKEMQQFADDIHKLRQRFDERLADAQKLLATEDAKNVAHELEKLFPQYMVQVEEVLRLTMQDDNGNAAKVMKEAAGIAKQVMDRAVTLSEMKVKHAEMMYQDSNTLYEQSRNLMIGLSVGGVLLGLLLGWLIAKLLVTNVRDVIAAAKKMAGGDLTARSTLTTKEEMGTLATVFNEMAGKIESDVTRALEAKGKMEAVSKAQGVIEFAPDGKVLAANDKFLQCMGYSLEEVTGRYHRQFCDSVSASSADYTNFWAKLNRGEFDAGVYRRLGKGGKERWLQASYNPIMDANGKLMKVVQLATDITEQKNSSAEFEGKITAVGKSQAVIELGLDGTILTANENFCRALGYSLYELKGQHHRMLCESQSVNSPEYQAFWDKLNRGEFAADTYKRLGKGGKEVWLQASYNPILDANGKPAKVVQYATDVTGQKQAQVEVEKLIVAAAAGQLGERIKTEQFEGTAKGLTESFNKLLEAVATPLQEAQTVLAALAANDLTKAMMGTYQGEFEQMKVSVNSALQNLSTTVTMVRAAIEGVTSGAEEITKGSEDLSQRTSQQASALEQTSASMEEMTSTVKQNADNAKQANQLAVAARETADKGGVVTKKAVDAMGEINKSSSKIADIITVIDEIAFQTNLLALNAAVEAARAGEHGRGFAVVAAEVRNLAQRSATAAKEIKGLINESIQRVNDGSELVNQSGKTLEEIVSSVKRVTDIIAEITAASQEQASGIDQVNKAIMSMDETTQQNAALVEETTSASQSMKEQAKGLLHQVEVFKVAKTFEGASLRGATPAAGSMARSITGKPMLKQPTPTVPVGAKSGYDSVAQDDAFEEF